MAATLIQIAETVAVLSVQGGVLIALALAARSALRHRLKPGWTTLLWLLVMARLAVPWTPETPLHVHLRLPWREQAAIADAGDAESLAAAVLPAATEADAAASGASARLPGPASASGGLPSVAEPAPPSDAESDPPSAAEPSGTEPSGTEPSRGPSFARSDAFALLAPVWLLGAATVAACLLRANLRFLRGIAGLRPVDDPALLALWARCRSEHRYRRRVRLYATALVSSPTVVGAFRPRLLVPEDELIGLGGRQIRHIFFHEIAHLRRRDLLVGSIMSVLLALHWFNPLVWLAYRKMREDQEIACDAAALSRLSPDESDAYAETILTMLARMASPLRLANAAGLSGSKRELVRRLTRIQSRSREPARPASALIGLSVLLALSGCAAAGAGSGKPGADAGGAAAKPEDADYRAWTADAVPANLDAEKLGARHGAGLYGLKNMAGEYDTFIVTADGRERSFHWDNALNYGYPVFMDVADYDKDGKDEIAVILHTTINQSYLDKNMKRQPPDRRSLDELHVLNREDLTELPVADPVKAVRSMVDSTIKVQGGIASVEFRVPNQTPQLREYEAFVDNPTPWNDRIAFGSSVSYSFWDGTLRAEVAGSLRGAYDNLLNVFSAVYGPDLQVQYIGVRFDSAWKTA